MGRVCRNVFCLSALFPLSATFMQVADLLAEQMLKDALAAGIWIGYQADSQYYRGEKEERHQQTPYCEAARYGADAARSFLATQFYHLARRREC